LIIKYFYRTCCFRNSVPFYVFDDLVRCHSIVPFLQKHKPKNFKQLHSLPHLVLCACTLPCKSWSWFYGILYSLKCEVSHKSPVATSANLSSNVSSDTQKSVHIIKANIRTCCSYWTLLIWSGAWQQHAIDEANRGRLC